MGEIFFFACVFIVSLYAIIKGADLFIDNAEKIGIFFGMPAFVIGVLIVGVGTSLPELASALSAMLQGTSEIVAANAVGSNIANILLVGGILAVLVKRFRIERNLLDSELPFFVISTALFLGVIFDGTISIIESSLLAGTYGVYLYYLFSKEGHRHDVILGEKEHEIKRERRAVLKLPEFSIVLKGIIGLLVLLIGAKYLIESVITLAEMLKVSPGVISLTAIALGTSLPELSVSMKAMHAGKLGLSIGNIFGSNAFNILLAVGIPGLLGTINVDPKTLGIGVPILAVASFLLFVIGLARKMYRFEGILFLVFYLFFLLKLVGL